MRKLKTWSIRDFPNGLSKGFPTCIILLKLAYISVHIRKIHLNFSAVLHPSCIITCSRRFSMSFTHKIDEWMKEAETRPESAVTIVKLVTRRLRELTERNEEL